MCGIVALVSKDHGSVSKEITNSLIELQNRGYDSAGVGYFVTVMNDEKLCKQIKTNRTCTVTNAALRSLVNGLLTPQMIGHTRWATHGINSVANAHPHMSYDRVFAVVHNGVIENFAELRTDLIEHAITFRSDTDTEVVANLIAYEYENCESIIVAVHNACARFIGSFALAILCVESESTYVIRRDSPMLIGESEKMVCAASEISAFPECMREYSILEPFVIAEIGVDGIRKHRLVPMSGQSMVAESKLIPNRTRLEDTKEHWVKKEILEQGKTLMYSTGFGSRIANGIHLDVDVAAIQPNVLLVGCGSSLYACESAAPYFGRIPLKSLRVIDGSELVETDVKKSTLMVICSQSGETGDLLRCIDVAKERNAYTLCVTNVEDSTLARQSNGCIYLNVGREVGVASTKSFTSCILVLYLLHAWILRQSGNFVSWEVECVNATIKSVNEFIRKLNLCTFYDRYRLGSVSKPSMYILGKGRLGAIAREGALKIKEMCYIHAEGFYANSLKHGPFALIDAQFPIILLIDAAHREEMMVVYNEVITRGAKVIIVTDCYASMSLPDVVSVINVGEGSCDLCEIKFAIALQCMAYAIAIKRGIDPDRPRNLAKVVTVT